MSIEQREPDGAAACAGRYEPCEAADEWSDPCMSFSRKRRSDGNDDAGKQRKWRPDDGEARRDEEAESEGC